MSIEFIIGAIQYQYQPPLYFCAGLFVSFAICLLALVVESAIRRRQFDSADVGDSSGRYQKYRKELTHTARHVGFTVDEIHELQDHEFHRE